MVTLFLKCAYQSDRRGTKFTFTLGPKFLGPKPILSLGSSVCSLKFNTSFCGYLFT